MARSVRLASTTREAAMAAKRQGQGKPDLTPDALAPGPDEAAAAMPVTGILGDSPDDEHARLFLDLRFSTYYDIPRDAIVQREQLPAERSPLGVDSSLLLVRKNTQLEVHRVASRSIEHEFLAGDFTASGTFHP